MTDDDVMNLPGHDNPVLCTDGILGMLVVYPINGQPCGVQVPGEEEHRWIESGSLSAGAGGALRQAGAPTTPPPAISIEQVILSMDWTARGGAN